MLKLRALVLALLLLCIGACERGMRDMYDQNRPHPDGSATRFGDDRDARPPPDDAVANSSGILAADSSGRTKTASDSLSGRAMLERGRNRYNIYCAPCHSPVGDGDGMVVRRGFPKPESFHTPRLRTLSDADFDNAVVKGIGTMKPMGGRVDEADRRAIVAYIRALQLSQNATLDDVPADHRATIGGSAN